MKPQKINLKTEDGEILKGAFYETNTDKCVLLLHQFSKNKEMWNELIKTIIKHHSALAIDLRGHGESTRNYKDFKEKDFKNMKKDVETAINFLLENKYEEQNISIIGSSIGANLAQNYSAANTSDKTVLLSPGHNYKGIKIIIKETKALIIVSEEDTYSYETVKNIEEKCKKTNFVYLKNKGHGLSMLNKEIINSITLFLIG